MDAKRLAPYNPSRLEVIEAAIELAELGPNDVVYDLGCGDGRVLVEVAKRCKCKCIGVESEKRYYDRAIENVKQAGLEGLVEIRYGDALKTEDVATNATVIYVYLTVDGNSELNELLGKAFSNGVKVISNMFRLEYLGEPKAVETCDGITKLYLYHEENALFESIQRMLDPLRNRWLIYIFNASIVLLLLLLGVMWYSGLGNIHVKVMGIIAIGLLASFNYVLRQVQYAVDTDQKAASLVKQD